MQYFKASHARSQEPFNTRMEIAPPPEGDAPAGPCQGSALDLTDAIFDTILMPMRKEIADNSRGVKALEVFHVGGGWYRFRVFAISKTSGIEQKYTTKNTYNKKNAEDIYDAGRFDILFANGVRKDY